MHTPAFELVRLLTQRALTVATAESCTGGLIAAALTEVPDASRVFHYGWVTYCNEAKIKQLGVPPELIARHSVVSEPVVLAMAESARRLAAADCAIAVSGNAGPTAAPDEPPVGTVCIALLSPTISRASTLFLPNLSRSAFRQQVVRTALSSLLELLNDPTPETSKGSTRYEVRSTK